MLHKIHLAAAQLDSLHPRLLRQIHLAEGHVRQLQLTLLRIHLVVLRKANQDRQHLQTPPRTPSEVEANLNHA